MKGLGNKGCDFSNEVQVVAVVISKIIIIIYFQSSILQTNAHPAFHIYTLDLFVQLPTLWCSNLLQLSHPLPVRISGAAYATVYSLLFLRPLLAKHMEPLKLSQYSIVRI